MTDLRPKRPNPTIVEPGPPAWWTVAFWTVYLGLTIAGAIALFLKMT